MNSKKNEKKYKKEIELIFDLLDKTTIAKLLTFTAEELFNIQEKASLEFEKADYRKKWIDGVIELKYKSTIEKSYKKAVEYFNNEPLQEMDKYNSELIHYIEDGEFIVKVEFYRTKRIKDNNKECPQVKKGFSLIKINKTNKNKTNGGHHGNK